MSENVDSPDGAVKAAWTQPTEELHQIPGPGLAFEYPRAEIVSESSAVELSLERAELVTESYQRSEGSPAILRRALALRHVLESISIEVSPEERIFGRFAVLPGVVHLFPELFSSWAAPLRAQPLSSVTQYRVNEIERYWSQRCLEARLGVEQDVKNCRDTVTVRQEPSQIHLALGTINPDYRRVLRLGMTGLISELRHFRCVLSSRDAGFEHRRHYLEAAEMSAKACVAFAARHYELARQLFGPEFCREHYIDERIPNLPPAHFQDALQTVHLCHIISSGLEHPGLVAPPRLAVLLAPFYKKDRENGRIDFKDAVRLFQDHVSALTHAAGANASGQLATHEPWAIEPSIILGGFGAGGGESELEDVERELERAILEAVRRVGTSRLVVALRVSKGMSRVQSELIDDALDIAARGRAEVVLYYDETATVWHSSAALSYLDPAAARRLSLGQFVLVDAVRKTGQGRTFRRVGRRGAKLLPNVANQRARKMAEIVPFAFASGEGRLLRGLRAALDQITLLDSGRLVSLAWQWVPSGSLTPSWSGLSFKGGLSPNHQSYKIDLEHLLLETLRGEGHSDSPESRKQHVFKSENELLDSFEDKLLNETGRCLRAWDALEEEAQNLVPRPFASVVASASNFRGVDGTTRADGAYHALRIEGLQSTTRLLELIRTIVFDQQRCSTAELGMALTYGFDGYEDIEKMLREESLGLDEGQAHALDEFAHRVRSTIRAYRDSQGRPVAAAFVDDTSGLRERHQLDVVVSPREEGCEQKALKPLLRLGNSGIWGAKITVMGAIRAVETEELTLRLLLDGFRNPTLDE